jgi:hypothetical protein
MNESLFFQNDNLHVDTERNATLQNDKHRNDIQLNIFIQNDTIHNDPQMNGNVICMFISIGMPLCRISNIRMTLKKIS